MDSNKYWYALLAFGLLIFWDQVVKEVKNQEAKSETQKTQVAVDDLSHIDPNSVVTIAPSKVEEGLDVEPEVKIRNLGEIGNLVERQRKEQLDSLEKLEKEGKMKSPQAKRILELFRKARSQPSISKPEDIGKALQNLKKQSKKNDETLEALTKKWG